jgi:hypothetical protein
MAYLAAINGAKGILFYQYPDETKHGPQYWENLKRVARELKQLSPILLSPTVTLPVSLDVQGPSRLEGKSEKDRIEFVVKSDGHKTYLIAANNWPGTRQASFSFESDLRRSVVAPFENRRIRAYGNSFWDTFKPYDVHVYRLSFASGSGKRR